MAQPASIPTEGGITLHLAWWLVLLDGWTWWIAHYRGVVVVLLTLAGAAAPVLNSKRRRIAAPGPALVINSAAKAFAYACLAVAVSTLLHFDDLRWLPPGQRGHFSIGSGGILGRLGAGAVNAVAAVPVEWHATKVALHSAVVFAAFALAAFAVAAFSSSRAFWARVRQIVREEVGRR